MSSATPMLPGDLVDLQLSKRGEGGLQKRQSPDFGYLEDGIKKDGISVQRCHLLRTFSHLLVYT